MFSSSQLLTLLLFIIDGLYQQVAFASSWSNKDKVSYCDNIDKCQKCAQSYTISELPLVGKRTIHCKWCIGSKRCVTESSSCSGHNDDELRFVQLDGRLCPHEGLDFTYTTEIGLRAFLWNIALLPLDEQFCLFDRLKSADDPFLSRIVDKHLIDEFEQTLRYEVICDTLRNATCEAVLSVSAGMQSVYLAFRGPRIDDRLVSAIRLDGQFAQFGTYDNFTFPTSANKLNGNDIGGVLPYFHKLFKAIWNDNNIAKDIAEFRQNYTNYNLYVTGYSIGGSLATLAAVRIVQQQLWSSSTLHLITYGEPRTGNILFARYVESLIAYRIRIVNGNDLVSNIPMSLDPIGVVIRNSASHYRYLVHYPNGMTHAPGFRICHESEDKYCRNLRNATSIDDHRNYFGVNLDVTNCKLKIEIDEKKSDNTVRNDLQNDQDVVRILNGANDKQ